MYSLWKLFLSRPGQPFSVPEGQAAGISRQSTPEDGKVIRHNTGHLYPPRNIPGNHFCCGPGSSVGIETGYGLDGPGSNPGGDEIFRSSRHALWST